MDDTTVIITAFRRPEKVEQQVRSIRQYYPGIPIIVGDNGDQYPDLSPFSNCTLLTLPFDAGLSATRNALIDRCSTPYIMLCDDDFVWTEATDLRKLRAVLDHDPSIGMAGAMIDEPDRGPVSWALDIHVQNGWLVGTAAAGEMQRTRSGVRYFLADTLQNCALFRRAVYDAIRWDDALKMAEHWDFYYRLKLAGVWRPACVPAVSVFHDKLPRPKEYAQYRNRGMKFLAIALANHGLQGVNLPHFPEGKRDRSPKPNIVVLTPGHTRSSVVCKMLSMLGWNIPAKDQYYEPSQLRRRINAPAKLIGFDARRAVTLMRRCKQPWVIKDPRMSDRPLWDAWQPVLEPYHPALLYVTLAPDKIVASYERRRESTDLAKRRIANCEAIYREYPGAKLRVDADDLAAAIEAWDASRIGQGLPGA